MPTYEYRCDTCGRVLVRACRMADHTSHVPCSCGGTASQLFRAMADFLIDKTREDGYNVGLGRAFKSKRELSRWLNRNNIIEVGREGEKEALAWLEAAREEKRKARQ